MVASSFCYDRKSTLRLQLHCAIYRPDSFVLTSRHCANLKAIRYESTNLNRIVADKSQSVTVALKLPEDLFIRFHLHGTILSCHCTEFMVDHVHEDHF